MHVLKSGQLFYFSLPLMEHTMFRNIVFAAALVSTSIAFAGTSHNTAIISDKDEIITVAFFRLEIIFCFLKQII
jgi:hypothetical protein